MAEEKGKTVAKPTEEVVKKKEKKEMSVAEKKYRAELDTFVQGWCSGMTEVDRARMVFNLQRAMGTAIQKITKLEEANEKPVIHVPK